MRRKDSIWQLTTAQSLTCLPLTLIYILASDEQHDFAELPVLLHTDDADYESCSDATGGDVDSDDDTSPPIDMAKDDWLSQNNFIAHVAQSLTPLVAVALTSTFDSDTDMLSAGLPATLMNSRCALNLKIGLLQFHYLYSSASLFGGDGSATCFI